MSTAPLRRLWHLAKSWILFRLDQFVGWSPIIQIPALIALTAVLVIGWSWVAYWAGEPDADLVWWTLTRFMDGGTMAVDEGYPQRYVAVGVTLSGVLLISLMIGAISAKLSERIGDLRRGTSGIAVHDHVLVLGFDAKIPLMARELARTHKRLTMVTLSTEDKTRVEVLLKSAHAVRGGRLRTIARTGDPRSEVALLRVAADRARTIVILAPAELEDEAAMRWTLSALLAIRRVTAGNFRGPIIVEARRAAQVPLLSLAGEAGLAGDGRLSIHVIASDDIVARVLAQSIRHGAVYLALRELVSFAGSEIYLEPVPRELVGHSFEEAHARLHHGILVGLRHADGSHEIAPPRIEDTPIIREGDELLVLEENLGEVRGGGSLPSPPPVDRLQMEASDLPQVVAILGGNRSLGCLISELDAVLAPGSILRLSAPQLTGPEQRAITAAAAQARRVRVEQVVRSEEEVGRPDDPALADADGVVILGCDDHNDPDGDTSALALLLQLRHARRAGKRPDIRRLITEVRDPLVARQVASAIDDFLVSTDIVGMTIAHAAFDARLLPVYREILDPVGVEICVRPRRYYVPDGPATFGLVMIAARRRGDIAVGFFVEGVRTRSMPSRAELELGVERIEPAVPVTLNPDRDTDVPQEGVAIVVLSHRR